MPEKGTNEDIDNYSDDEEHTIRKIKIQPMNLTEQELKARLQTLKDYSTWKNTKIKRILIRELTDEQKSPIINAALSYGNSNGANPVLLDYIRHSEPNFHQLESEKVNPFQKLLNEHTNKNNKLSQNDPSFINYKTRQNQKEKIYRMANVSTQQQIKTKFSYKKQGAKTQGNLLLKNHSHYQSFPKELVQLKNKLQGLPSICKRMKTQKVELNPQDEGNSLGLTSNYYQESALLKIGSHIPIKLKKREDQDHFLHRRIGRETYLKDIKSILSKSDLLLDEYAKNEQDKLKVSFQSGTNSVTLSEDKSERIKLNHKLKKSCYWPNYSKYSMAQSDRAKLQNLLKQFCQFNHEKPQIKEETIVMAKIMQRQFNSQQKQMDREVVEEEKNSFQYRFKHKINLERENYKRNVKELVRCKKEYRIQKQREEIRANGIKRNRKLEDIQTPKMTIELDAKQDEY